jgi:hypothetical protein
MLVSAASCPKCRTSLAMPRPVPVGTRLDCPRCLNTFRAPAPKPGEEIDEPEVIDDSPDDGDIPVVEAVEDVRKAPTPRYRKKPPPAYRLADGTPRFRPRRKGKSNAWVGIVIAVVGGVIVLATLGWLIVAFVRGGPGDEPLAFVPPDANFVAGLRVGDLSRELPAVGRLLDQYVSGPAGGAASVKENVGIEARDLYDQLMVGLSGDGSQFTIIIKSRIPFDRRKFNGPQKRATKVTAFGQSYFKVDEPAAPIKTMYCPNNRILVVSSLADQQLAPILRADGKKPGLTGPVGELAAKLSPHHFWVIVTPEALRGPLFANNQATPPALAELSKSGTAVALWATVQGGNVDLHIGLNCADDAAAKDAVTKMQTEMPQLFTGLDAIGIFKPAVKRFADELRSSAAYTASGSLAEMSAKVSVPTLEAVVPDLQTLAGGR